MVLKDSKDIVKTFQKATLAICALLMLPNCSSQDLEFAQTESELKSVFVYSDSVLDQQLLLEKISGYDRPGLNTIFNQWSRISGSRMYQSVSDIVLEPQFEFCNTGINSSGYWNPTVHPITGDPLPGRTYNGYRCIESEALAGMSWSYLSSINGLRLALNSLLFVGFVSAIPFEIYENEAVMTSARGDDDSIGLIVASVRDDSGNIHTLSASRNQGGAVPYLGWGFVHYINGEPHAFHHDVSVGGVYVDNGSTGGWRNRQTRIKVNRNRNIVTAYASDWFTGSTVPDFNPISEISVDLSDPALGLEIFLGPQKYGYGAHSQEGATFTNIHFDSLVDVQYIYDLKNNRVYKLIEDGSGSYELLSRASAFKMLGSNTHVINPEIQKAYFLWINGRYREVDGDTLDQIPTN